MDKTKVKVIKKDEIKAPEVKAVKPSKRAQAREMVSTVSTWVNDFQSRKRDETKIAIDKFFSTQPRPSES
jgi:hypothetical protein